MQKNRNINRIPFANFMTTSGLKMLILFKKNIGIFTKNKKKLKQQY